MVCLLPIPKIGVFYMAWGRRSDPITPLRTFIESYKRHAAGVEHELCILFKGFQTAEDLFAAHKILKNMSYRSIFVEEREWDIGAYFVGASQTDFDVAVFMNTYSEILSKDWLIKLTVNLALQNVGLVGCTGSYEAAYHPNVADNAPFPNPHLRSNAFAVNRKLFLRIRPLTPLTEKLGTHLFEHGSSSMSRQITSQGLRILIVGRDGQGFAPQDWPKSGTFRQADQSNLLIADNRTKDYDAAPLPEKRALFKKAWGDGSHGQIKVKFARTGHDDELFVRSLYRTILGRVAHDIEVEGWISALDDGLTREEMFAQTYESAEALARRARDPTVLRLFRHQSQQVR